jgi:hypothetical protein
LTHEAAGAGRGPFFASLRAPYRPPPPFPPFSPPPPLSPSLQSPPCLASPQNPLSPTSRLRHTPFLLLMLQEVPIPNAVCETSCDWCDWQPRGLPPAARRDPKCQPNEAMATMSMGHNRMTARSRREGRGVVKKRSSRNSTHKNPPDFFFLPHTRALERGRDG